MKMPGNVFVTGSSGFIGRNLVTAFLDDGWLVNGIDIDDEMLSKPLRDGEKFTWSELDPAFLDYMEFSGQEIPDVIIHAAAQTSVKESVNDPANDAGLNIVGTVSVLEYCRTHDIPIIYVSDLNANLLGKENPYLLSKSVGEAYCFLYNKLFGLKTLSLRLGTVYGIGGKGLVETWLRGIANDGSIDIEGIHEGTWDFICVSDVMSAFKIAVDKIIKGEIDSGKFNIGNGLSISHLRLLYEICLATGYDYWGDKEVQLATPVHKKYKKTKEILQWEPKIELVEGLEMLYKEMKNENYNDIVGSNGVSNTG
jgi:UDP-glucose 4-epimerase